MIVTCGVLAAPATAASAVVINEIYYHPPDQRPLEFIELHNAGTARVSLAGWALGKFEFPAEATLTAGGFAVVARDPVAFRKEFGFQPYGPWPGKLKHSGDKLSLRDPAGRVVDRVEYQGAFPWPPAAAGGGASLERVHPSLPGDEAAAWRSSGFPDPISPQPAWRAGSPRQPGRPTPGATNSVFALQPPPLIRAVEHHPAQPKPGQPVTVTALVGAVGSPVTVTLSLQFVEPGAYVAKTDRAFATNWVTVPMRDDGRDGDERAGDGRFTAVVPGDAQRSRRLARYRLSAAGATGPLAQAPLPEDDSANFAWFTYEKLPAWTGASRPGRTPPLLFSSEMLGTLSVYHLLARRQDVERSQWDGGANRRRFWGTLVYDGRVYDHIQFHNRGQASTYNTGKNKWGFKFNRGHDFAPRDAWGRLYAHPWHSLDLNACACPWVQMNRGMAGLDEALPFRAYQLAGVPAANTHWVHLRVIDALAETSPSSQYEGDLWGLYLAVQDMSGPWLDELGLPDGDLFSTQSGRKHLARGRPADDRDWNRFRGGVARDQPEAWWRTNLDLPAYYSFHALNRLLANVDLRESANHGYYRSPEGLWAPIPWDLDMMFIPHSHQSGVIDAIRCLNVPRLQLEYQSRAREILDLFTEDPAPDGGQVGQLIAELARALCPPGQPRTWPELDEALWNYHPHSHTQGAFYVNPSELGWSGVTFRRVLATPDFAGFCRYLLEFCTDSRPRKNYRPDDNIPQGHGYGLLAYEARDDLIPARPVIRYAGPSGFAAHRLAFTVSPFQGARPSQTLAAIQWRAAEITAPGLPGYDPGQPQSYELQPRWTSPPWPTVAPVFTLPAEACRPGRTCRVRARYQDSSGRWSHWSPPIQFIPATTGERPRTEG